MNLWRQGKEPVSYMCIEREKMRNPRFENQEEMRKRRSFGKGEVGDREWGRVKTKVK